MGARFNAFRDKLGAKISDFALTRICTPFHGQVVAKAIDYGMSMAHEDVHRMFTERNVEAIRASRFNPEAITVVAYLRPHPTGRGVLVTVPDFRLMVGYVGPEAELGGHLEMAIAMLTGTSPDGINVNVIDMGGE